jgi:threonine dehydratase
MTPDEIRAAAIRIRPFVQRTPVLGSTTLSRLAGCELFFKCELFQKTGSFKYRGATNAVQKLPAEVAARGVVTHSSGNHAQALALAAKVRGIRATVVMPRTAPAVKKAAVLGYGATVIDCEPTLAAREDAAGKVVAETGATLIPPFDHADVIAGQGTIALELLEDCPQLSSIIVPVGGGGMLSGVAIAAKNINTNIKIIGAEPAAADDACRSKASGERIVAQPPPQTVADGLMTTLGQLTWPVVRDHVDEICTVSEAEIIAAMRLVWERMKLVIEPSAAVGVAVALQAKPVVDGPTGIILCGGNVSLDQFYWS